MALTDIDNNKLILKEQDIESQKNLTCKANLSASQAAELIRNYVIVPKNKLTPFDPRAILQLKKDLAETKLENERLKKKIYQLMLDNLKLQEIIDNS